MAGRPIWSPEGLARRLARTPVVAATALLAVAITVPAWAGRGVLPFQDTPLRHVTGAFLHGDLLHILFNLYWLVVLGTVVEEMFGHVRTAALVLGLAAGASTWQEALGGPGIGLSGVGYGLFGFVWVFARRDPRFLGVLSTDTVVMFVVWFFACIAATLAGTMNVANVAHGAGAVLGAGVGAAATRRGGARLLFALVTGALAVAGAVLAETPLRHHLTDGRLARHRERQAFAALDRRDWAEAARLLAEATTLDPSLARAHYNLGVALDRLGRDAEALAAFERAQGTASPEDPVGRNARVIVLGRRALDALRDGRLDEAAALLDEAITLDPDATYPRRLRARLRGILGRHDEALEDLAIAKRGEPDATDLAAEIAEREALRAAAAEEEPRDGAD